MRNRNLSNVTFIAHLGVDFDYNNWYQCETCGCMYISDISDVCPDCKRIIVIERLEAYRLKGRWSRWLYLWRYNDNKEMAYV